MKGKGERGKHTQLNAEFQRITRRDKKALLNEQSKKLRETIEWEKLEMSSKQLELAREYLMQAWA